jgi:sugar/nucleoside kinase (ribokinase family)
MSLDVFGVGNALVDIQARITDEVLAQLDYRKGIMTLVDAPTQERVLAAIAGARVTRCAGGSAANTVMAVADFGGKAAYAGKVGPDEIGTFFLSDMRRMGVAIDVAPLAGPSGTSVILITEDAQRTMLTHLGVSAELKPEDIREEDVRRAQYVYVEGYLFTGEGTRAAAYRTIELAKKHGVKVAFTVSDPFLIGLFRDEFLKLIEGPVDLLFCNLEEARALTGKHDAVECAVEIHRHAENVALTLGAAGSILMHQGEVLPIEGVTTDAIDTTGAGDMYAGALLYGITSGGMTWKQAGHLASHAAARIVAQLGARLQNRFTPQEIARLME